VPPTFLLVLAILAAALISPVVAIGTLILVARPGTRLLGGRLLACGAMGAGLAILSNVVLNTLIGQRPSAMGTAVGAGAGFTIAIAAYIAHAWWRRRRRYLEAAR
jgi:hypothetical protein